MIADENKRMRRQTEKILQMAMLEEGDFDLKRDAVDLHRVINDAADNTALQIESRNGGILRNLKAEKRFILADKIHISGIIYNLLDNASKYSREKPQITISTWNNELGIFIRVEDKGIGIRDEDLKYVFEKYFRVSSGNIHDVKGFGLGLSYVKLMVEAHGGKAAIKSNFGIGTSVELFFPVIEPPIAGEANGD
jgi:two-component system phosphate regulon sensor histidine kinase PhoR